MPAEPSSLTTRPQYGSCPYHEHLHSWLSATLRAPVAASSSDAAPTTLTRTTFVAPSASPAICSARSAHAAVRAMRSSASSTGPACPLASTMTVSLVEVHPSTDKALKEDAT